MINYIHGILSEVEDSLIVMEAGGVGYGIMVPSTCIPELPPKGSELKIYTYYCVKEDSQSLYGFLFKEDREMFKQLISVNGVGPKGALAILSLLKPDDLRMALITGDAKAISRAQGVGAKTAQRIILDLKDKVTDADFIGAMSGGGLGTASSGTFSAPMVEALEALSSLGYTRSEAGRILGRLEISEGMSVEDIIKAALKSLRV